MKTTAPLLQRMAVLAYGLFSYAITLGVFYYAFGFLGNLLVPKSIDSAATTSLGNAVLVNAGLLALFAVQHSVMARPFFKDWLTQIIPQAAERATYVLASCLAMGVLFVLWQPMGGIVWNAENHAVRMLLYGGYVFGWLLLFAVTFFINHFDLFGLRQVWLYFRGRPYTGLKFVTPGPYKLVRHPLYIGWFCCFWFTPTMTAAHLLFAIMTTLYILVAIQLEERDLEDAHPEYTDYKRRTPMLVPRLGGEAKPVTQYQD
ncbi:MAG TPA: DUF1295 domain-containing protein [Candidatus Didemnitutus sp.]|nr:DUF1295 domain-containing protein [Candidatus Didemnitutus sp.]